MRRLMVEIAQKIAAKDDCSALITGESIGQVASQTMQGLVCTDAVSQIPIFRPLIGMDKTEIVETARQIDTFELSTLPYEDSRQSIRKYAHHWKKSRLHRHIMTSLLRLKKRLPIQK